ncbi:hypothetical protein SAMN05216259_101404 [Actinacidiphila guanduensis]|uniref:Uncharacterized protein n=1 Tax=Actinacidiphila guanduensis TaxID=310781 RepID=A0A1G9VUK3_9ACTN|nr:hypothetical protein SAMN05216259_101404 [Actinacidiphila guanduensis]
MPGICHVTGSLRGRGSAWTDAVLECGGCNAIVADESVLPLLAGSTAAVGVGRRRP